MFLRPPPKEKAKEIEHGVEKAREMKKLVENLRTGGSGRVQSTETSEEEDAEKGEIEQKIKSTNKKIIQVKKTIYSSVKFMFDLMNIKYIQAQGEADIK